MTFNLEKKKIIVLMISSKRKKPLQKHKYFNSMKGVIVLIDKAKTRRNGKKNKL